MLKAGALYFSIVIAFFIAIISASLIMLAAHYRNSYLKEIRMVRLLHNMESGINVALNAEQGKGYGEDHLDLYLNGTDSLSMQRKPWGVFDLVTLKTFILQDTLKRSFLTGSETLKDTVALYLSDEDRPLSVSGDTRITGDVQVPKSGMKKSYVESRPYSGDRLVYGRISDSERSLKGLKESYLNYLTNELNKDSELLPILQSEDLKVSFLDSGKVFKVLANQKLRNTLSGHITLYSDTTVILTANAKIEHVVIFAPSIKVEDGFKGNCQLFATDSIIIGNGAELRYPSVAGLIAKEKTVDQSKIVLGKKVIFNGIIFSYEPKRSALQTMVTIGESSTVNGEIYATGLVKMSKGGKIAGKISCNRFIMQTPTTLYENFLVDIVINRKARNRFYLTSTIFKGAKEVNSVLRWLD